VRLSEFRIAVTEEFGEAYGRVVTRDLVLGDIGGLTADQAVKAGVSPRAIWNALCEANDVPADRRYGVGLHDPRK
jgi:hypothetical protein